MKNKLQICFVIDSLQIGGANKLNLKVIELLLKRGHSIKLLILYKIEPEFFFDDLLKYDFIVEYLNFDKLHFIKRITLLYKAVKLYPIVHSSLESANLYCSIVRLFIKKSVKFIATFHGIDGVYIDNEELKNVLRSQWTSKYIFKITTLQNILFKYYDGFIALCLDTKKFLIEKRRIPDSKVEIIYHGSDINELESKETSKSEIKLSNKLKLGSNDFLLGYVGRITYAKGIIELLESFKKILQIFPNLKLLLIGEGELKTKVDFKIKELNLENYIIQTGFHKDVLQYYKIINVFLLPSYSESLSLVTQEAMYNKLICLCSDCGGLPEVIDDKVDGFLFKKGDFKEFETKLKYIINNYQLLNNVKLNAKNKIIQKFDINKNIFQIENYFQRIILKKEI